MSTTETKPVTEFEALLTPRIILGALTASQIMYVFVLYSIVGANFTGEHTLFDPAFQLSIPFVITSVVTLALAFFLPKKLWISAGKSLNTNSSIPPNKIVEKYFTPFIIRLALLESICLFGFVIGTITHDYYRIFPFVSISFIGNLMNYPTMNTIKDRLGLPFSS